MNTSTSQHAPSGLQWRRARRRLRRWIRAPEHQRRRFATLLVLAGIGIGTYFLTRTPPLGPPSRRIASFRITYEVTESAGRTERATRVIIVRRPFESRDQSTPHGEIRPSFGIIASRSRVIAIQEGRLVDFGPRPLQPAPADVQYGVQLPDLGRSGLAQSRGSNSYAGRGCRIYRVGGPVPDPFRRPSKAEYADICVDEDGLLLYESWIVNGKPLRRTEALRVEIPGPKEVSFSSKAPTSSLARSRVVQQLPANQIPNTGVPYWAAPTPPWGFRLVQRARVLTLPQQESGTLATELWVDAYVLGPYVINVEHVRAELPRTDVRRIEVGALGVGRLLLTPRGPQLDFDLGEGFVARVSGTVDVPHLIGFARALRSSRPN